MKKCIFGTTLLNKKNIRRYVQWINYYSAAFPGYDLMLGNDGGEENSGFADEVLKSVDASVRSKVEFVYFGPFLGRMSPCKFPGWRRSFSGVLDKANKEGYEKIIFLETDLYIRKAFLRKYADLFEEEIFCAGFSDEYDWMETSLQVLNVRSVREQLVAFFGEAEALMSDVCSERQIQKRFKPILDRTKGTRLEGRTKNIYEWEYYSQCDYATHKDLVEGPALAPDLSSGAGLYTVTFKAGDVALPFKYRPCTSDQEVLRRVFTQRNYDLQRLARGRQLAEGCARMVSKGGTPLVIDAGANIGASALYFSLNIPHAKVLALEPDEDNFKLLTRNTQGRDIHCLQAAVAAHGGRVGLFDPKGGPWAYRTQPTQEGQASVPSVSINDLLASQEPSVFPFIVKLDIVGAEQDVFSGDTQWIAKIPIIIVKLYDWLLPRTANSSHFLRCISAQNRDFVTLDETIFSLSNTLAL